MSYQEKNPAEFVKRLSREIWNEKKSLRSLIRGFSASSRKGTLTVYLSQPATEAVRKRLASLTGGMDLTFEMVASFHFTAVGSKLRRREGYSGRMAAYVRGADGRHYALTCGHVLQGVPRTSLPPDVLIQGNHHPAKFAVKSVFDFNPNGENRIDGALAQLYPSAIPPHNHLPDGSPLPTDFAVYAEGDEITHAVPDGKKGKIESTVATMLVTVGASEVMLNDMILARSTDGSQFVQQGDSGSLFVKTGDQRPLGMLLAKAKSSDGGPSDLALICPLERTLDLLSQEPMAREHYPGPYRLI